MRIALEPDADVRAVTDDINATVPGNWPETTAALVTSTRTLYDTGLSILSFTVNGFALITAFVALTVLGTVIWASLPGRRRQLALMRLIGASRTQISAVLFVESALIALVGGLLAVPVGIGLAYLATPLLGMVPGVPEIPWSQVVVPVAPLIAVPVVAVPALCWAAAGLAGRLIGDRHPLEEIGAAEIRSFPGRTAATGMAVVLAAAVMAVSWVSLVSVSAIADARSSDDPGPEIMVGAYSGSAPLDSVVLQALDQVDGADGTVPVTMGQMRLTGEPSPESASSPGQTRSETRLITDMVAGYAADFGSVTDGRFPLAESDPDAVYLPVSEQAPFRDGSTVTLTGPTGERALTVHYVADLPLSGLIDPSVTSAFGITTAPTAVWVKVVGDADRGDVLTSVRIVATIGGDLPVTGTAVTDAKVDTMVDTARVIATVMLAVAVVIAVLGAVVTLTTSLRGRSGESAVLRLLGMEGAQLRRLVGSETIVVGAVSALIGLAAGVLLGCVTAGAVAGALGVGTHIAVSLIALTVMGVVTVVALRAAVTGPVDKISLVPPADALRDANLGGNQ